MDLASAGNPQDVFVFCLAHAAATTNSPLGLSFSRPELQTAVFLLKQRLPGAARERGVLADLLFDTNGAVPYSERLEDEISSMVLSGTLTSRSATDPYYWLGGGRAKRMCTSRQFSSEDLALIGPLIPLFIECLSAVIAQRATS